MYLWATLVAANLDQGYTPVNHIVTTHATCQENTSRVNPTCPGAAAPLDRSHQETAAAASKSFLFTPHLHRKFFEKNLLLPLEGIYAAADVCLDGNPVRGAVYMVSLGSNPLTVPGGLRVGHVARYTTRPPPRDCLCSGPTERRGC